MKTTITLILTILSISHSPAQAPAIQWQKSYGGTGNDYANDFQSTPDGGYIVAGSSSSNNGDVTGNHGNLDFWVIKLDATGNIQWQKSLGGSNDDIARAIITTTDGGYIVAGGSGSNDGDVTGNHGGLNDYWVVKLDATGNIQWQKTFGGSGNDVPKSIRTASDGSYLVAGSSNSNNGDVTGNHGNYDYWVVKIDATGDMLWKQSFGGTGNDEALAILSTSDAGFILTGLSDSTNGDVTGNHGNFDYWVVKLEATGNLQWQKSLGGSSGDESTCIQQTADGGYIAAGATHSTDGNITGNHGIYDYWVVKLDGTGTIQWQKTLGGSSWDLGKSIQGTIDGGFVVGGTSGSNNGHVTGNHGGYDNWVVKLDATGNIQWQKSMGGSGDDNAQSILNTSDNGFIVAGYSNSTNGDITNNHGNSDVWLVRLSPDILANNVFDKLSLTTYPNPATNSLKFHSSIDSPITKISITDLNGKTVFETFESTNTINVEKLKQGMYILEVYSGYEKYSCKFIKK